MQFERFPTWATNEIDKASRLCVWGKHGGGRGIHAINWETFTMPKRLGGANIKRAQMMNWALLAKLAWRVMTCEGELWREVLIAKYGVKINDGAHFKNKNRSFQV